MLLDKLTQTAKLRYAASLFLGLLLGLTTAPIYAFPLLFISFPLILHILSFVQNRKEAFWLGFLYGFGFFLTSTYWVAFSFLVAGDSYAWATPLIILIVPSFFAFYIAIVFLLLFTLNIKSLAKVIVFSAIWTGLEIIRGYSLLLIDTTGFPWNLIGYSWSFSDHVPQIISISGIYGLSFLTVLIASLPYLSLRDFIIYRKLSVSPILFSLTLLAALQIFGMQRIPNEQEFTNLNLRIIHPNITKHHGFQRKNLINNMNKHIKLSAAYNSSADLVIWPESGVSFPVDKDDDDFTFLKAAIPQGAFLITGAPRYEKSLYFNSILLLNDEAKVVNYYDKINLVPFGEYIPHRKLIPFDSLVNLGQDFTAGKSLKTFNVKGSNFTPLICYDGIFPHQVASPKSEWLLNITNDIWFYRAINGINISSGPYQHFDIIKSRAIEEGLPMIRAANAGISAVIDPYGRVIEKLGLDEEGVIDSKLPKKTSKTTIFSKYGNKPIFALIGFILCLAFIKKIKD
jgi:apolipoprotein N-acyltransferase